MRVRDLQRDSLVMEESKGFYTGPASVNIDQRLLMVVGELVEAQNELRDGHAPGDIYYNETNPAKPEGFGIELADAIIRLAGTAEALNIDLQHCITLKHAYNGTRPRLHGKKF